MVSVNVLSFFVFQVLRWATGSVEIFFSRNNAFFASPRMKFLQRVAYLNVGIYPFTSIFLLVYCFLPALSLFTGQWSGEVRVVVAAPFEVRAHGVGFCEIIFLLGFCEVGSSGV